MKANEEVFSPERTELRRNLLEKSDLEYCHERYPACVRLLLVRRTRAVVEMKERKVVFHLSTDDHGVCKLQVEASLQTKQFEFSHPALWRLGFHVAVEAMLALRNGHKEYVRASTRRRKQDFRKPADIL